MIPKRFVVAPHQRSAHSPCLNHPGKKKTLALLPEHLCRIAKSVMVLTNAKGGVLPLGSKIENEAGQEVGIVGPDGQAFVTGAAQSGNLTVRWGQGKADQCVVPYSLPDEKNPPPIRELNGQCQVLAGDQASDMQTGAVK